MTYWERERGRERESVSNVAIRCLLFKLNNSPKENNINNCSDIDCNECNAKVNVVSVVCSSLCSMIFCKFLPYTNSIECLCESLIYVLCGDEPLINIFYISYR